MIRVVKGDLFEHITNQEQTIIVPHIVNNSTQFSHGFVAALNKRWPEEMGMRSPRYVFHKNKLVLGQSNIISVEQNIKVVNMCAQNNVDSTTYPRLVNYGALAVCMERVKTYIRNQVLAYSYTSMITPEDIAEKYLIYCPRFGSGIGGGDQTIVQEMIDHIWKEFDVTIFEL